MIILHLPIPPSVNALYRVRGGVPRKSERVKTWVGAAHGHFLEQGGHKAGKIVGRFHLTVILDEKRRGTSDADNRLKVLLDYLEKGARVISNDRLADSITVRWGHAPVGCTVMIEPVFAEAQAPRAAE